MRIGFVFCSHPHSSSEGREGLDALLATSAYCEEIDVFFIGEGVTQLKRNQQPDHIVSRDYSAAFKLLELYEVEDLYVCAESMKEFQLSTEDFLVDAECLAREELKIKMHACSKVLVF